MSIILLTFSCGFLALAHLADVPYGTSRSLSIDGVSITSTDAIIGDRVIFAKNTALNITNVYAYNMVAEGEFCYGENSTGHWENNHFRNITVSGGEGNFFLQQDLIWTFVNQTFEDIPSYSSYAILRLSTYFYDRPGAFVTFGGNITFLNCPSSILYDMDSAIVLLHDAGAAPIKVYSMASNPSKFVLQNSNMSLFLFVAGYTNIGSTSLEIGSIYADSYMPGNSELHMRYLFLLDMYDFDYAGSYSSVSSAVNITVLGDITSKGMGIASRGYSRQTQNPTDLTRNSWLQIAGSLTFTLNGDVNTAFLLQWPMDISANYITASLMPRASDGLVPTFMAFNATQFTSSAAHVNLDVTYDFIVKSTNTPFQVTDPSAPSSAPSSSPSSQTPSSSGSPIPYSISAPFNLDAENVAVVITAGSFQVLNFSLPRSSSFTPSFQGAAISVTESSLSISVDNGDLILSGNQNTAGAGGALYVGENAPETVLEATNGGNIVFSHNVAYYGGAVYIAPSGEPPAVQFLADDVELLGNAAVQGGGAAFIERSRVETLFTPSATVISGNGAAGFGCVFAFGLSAATSDVNDSVCQGNTYGPSVLSGGVFFGSSYQPAAYCTQYESLCDAIPIAAPVNPPTTPSAPSTPTTTPTTPLTPALTPGGCSANAKVPAGSQCTNGVYTTDAQALITYLGNNSTKPPTIDAPLVITGNVTVPAIVLGNVLHLTRGVAMLSSTGCIQISTVTVSLSSDDVSEIASEKSTDALLIQSSCSPSGTSILVVGATPKKSCQKTKVEATATPNSLTATFTISSSKCDVWWIILVSVICGVLLLVIIAVVVILLLPTEYRRKLQPFHKSKDTAVQAPRSTYTNIDQ